MSTLRRRAALALALALIGGPAHATDFLQAGLKLVLKANPTASTFKTVYVSKSPAPVLPAASPLQLGARFQILNLDGSCEYAELDLPASGWQTNAAGTLYKFVNKLAPGGPSPVKVGLVKAGAVLKVVAKSTGITLDEATQGRIGVALVIGGDRYCSVFGSPTKDEPNRFVSKNQPAPATCFDGVCCCDADQLKLVSGTGVGTTGQTLDGSGAVIDTLGNAFLYIGGGSSTLSGDLQPDNGSIILNASACSGGDVVLDGTTAAEAGSLFTCTNVGCFYGPPLPLQNPLSPLNTCIINVVVTDATGSANCKAGHVHVDLPLNSITRLSGGSGDLLPGTSCVGGLNNGNACSVQSDCPGAGAYCPTGPQPCPICVNGTCRGGPNDGGACVAPGTNIAPQYPTSHDCPPAGIPIGTLLVAYDLTSGTTRRGSSDGNICKWCRAANLGFGVCAGGTRNGLACLQQGSNPTTGCPSGGTCGNAVPCDDDADCAADAASRTTCEQGNEGAFGDSNVTTVTETGTPGGDLTDMAAHASTSVSVFCIPPTFNGSLDTTANLPGPGAVSLPGTVMLQNTTTTIATTTTSSTTTTTMGGSPSAAFLGGGPDLLG